MHPSLADGWRYSWARALAIDPLPQAIDRATPRIAFNRYAHDSEIVLVDVERGDEQVLTNQTIRSRDAAWSPDGTRIAFESEGELYVVDADGTNLQLLTYDWRSDDSRPAWSPDGTRIAFLREGDVFVVDPDGAHPRRLTFDEPSRRSSADVARWSPDGTRIVYTAHQGREDDAEIVVVDADGTNQRLLTDNISHDRNPMWSPDGTRIVFEGEGISGSRGVFVMMADGSNLQQLAAGTDPVWSPDGFHIALRSGGDVHVMLADGSGPYQLVRNERLLLVKGERPVWSPDGSRIAFSGLDGEILVVDSDGDNLQQISNRGFYDARPVWSPDSTRIAFQGSHDGAAEVFVVGGGRFQSSANRF